MRPLLRQPVARRRRVRPPRLPAPARSTRCHRASSSWTPASPGLNALRLTSTAAPRRSSSTRCGSGAPVGTVHRLAAERPRAARRRAQPARARPGEPARRPRGGRRRPKSSSSAPRSGAVRAFTDALSAPLRAAVPTAAAMVGAGSGDHDERPALRDRRRRPVRLLRRRAAARRGLRGRPARRAADAVRARARRRRARPPEDQVRHARLREDRGAPGLPLLRRRRARRATSRAPSCSSATTRSSTRSAPRATTGSGSPARTGRARTPRPSSSPGTTATPTTPTTSSTCRRGARSSIGNGNVAIDVARMLVLDPRRARGRPTPPTTRSTRWPAASVEEVVLLGRRGPAQAAFTNPELRELGELARADVVVDPAELQLDDDSAAWLESEDASATARRNVELLRELRAAPGRRPSATGSSCASCARRSRSSARASDGPVTGVRVARNRIERREDGAARGADRRGGGHRLRARAALDRLPRRAARRRSRSTSAAA